MEISEVRISLVDKTLYRNKNLLAFGTMVIDGLFIVRELRVVSGADGYFIAMPSRNITDHCSKCNGRNQLRSRFCNFCGIQQDPDRAPISPKSGKQMLFADSAHPVNHAARAVITEAVLAEYHAELERSKCGGYTPTYRVDDTLAEEADYAV